MNFKIFEKTNSLFFIIYLYFDKISLKKLSHHLQICARYNYKVAQLQNYKVAQNNYKVAQKLQSCAKITKLRITAVLKTSNRIKSCFLTFFHNGKKIAKYAPGIDMTIHFLRFRDAQKHVFLSDLHVLTWCC